MNRTEHPKIAATYLLNSFHRAGTGPYLVRTAQIAQTRRNIHGVTDPVQNSSLLLQRQLASLHRRGLAEKTMGEEEMCGTTYSYFIPRSQYRVSMLYPVPESARSRPLFDPPKQSSGGSSSPTSFVPSDDCCHRLGESVHQWSTLKGGRSRPGKENYVYLIWRYVDCCVPMQSM